MPLLIGAYLVSDLHVMVIWPAGGKPQIVYFRKSDDQRIPEPVGRIAGLIDVR